MKSIALLLEHVIINLRIYHRVDCAQALRGALSGGGVPRHAPERPGELGRTGSYHRGVMIAILQSNICNIPMGEWENMEKQ